MTKFNPSAWRHAGRAYSDAGTSLTSSVSSNLTGLDVNALGSNQGGHLVDMALALLVPAVKDAFDAACRDLADSMSSVGDAMTDTGDVYADLEEQMAGLAEVPGQDL